MGDMANVKVVDGDSTVFLYTHWAGSALPSTLQAAMKREKSWDDGPYLARIIFQQMIGRNEGETGYGISSVIGDGEDRVLTVNVDKQSVTIYSEYAANINKTVSFTEFIALSPSDRDW
jgi:hypothetical protein